jgi:hypothetical protein
MPSFILISSYIEREYGATNTVVDIIIAGFLGFHGVPLWAALSTKKY